MILFTFLGAGQYVETIYTLGDERHTSHYSPAASARFLGVQAVVAFLTAEAEKAHREGLEKALPSGCLLRCIPIPYGRDEGEFWEIFQTLSQEASTADDQSWDVTHGFRSLPLLTMLTLTFLRSGLGIKPSKVLYSLYEKDAESCPMIDLAPMLDLMDWASAANTFTRYGDSRPLAALLNNVRNGFMREGPRTKDQRVSMKPVTDLASKMEDLSLSLAFIRPETVVQSAERLKEYIPVVENALKFSPRTRPLSLLLPGIGRAYQPLAPQEGAAAVQLSSWLNLIDWYIEHGNYIQAATLEEEWVISWLMVITGNGSSIANVDLRRNLTESFNKDVRDFIDSKKIPNDLEAIQGIRDLFVIWYRLVEARNDLNHAGMRPQPKEPAAIIETVQETLKVLKQLPLEVE